MNAYASTSGGGNSPQHDDPPFAVRKGQGQLFLMRTEAAMTASEGAAGMRARHVAGLRMVALSQDEVLEMEPNLCPSACAGGGWWFPDGWYLNQPAALLRALAGGFERAGGEVRAGVAASAIRGAGSSGASVALVDGTVLSADEVVVAAGAHSATLVSESLGEFCPLETERGYHVAFEGGSEHVLSRAVTDPSLGWIATPMSGGLRVAGKVELGGVAAPPSPARWPQIETEARAVIGGLGPRLPDADWMGFRPTMPDSLPVIGRSSKAPCVYYAFGHQHVGWTLGGITGELIAELVQGKEPSVDLAPYSLDRFRFW